MPAMSEQSVRRLGTILGVWAHPDDEAYLSAGLMAVARSNGQRVVVVTATAGEAGNPEPERWTTARLAAARGRELAASLAVVGVDEHHWLGHADGGCERVAPSEGAAQIERIIHAVRPDTILTFGADGMTGHTDHRAVSAWTTTAWEATGRRARLYYATLVPEFHDEWDELNRRLSIWAEGWIPPSTPSTEVALDLACDGGLLDRKLRALTAHASQTAGLIAIVGEATYARWWACESFVEASAQPSSRARPGPHRRWLASADRPRLARCRSLSRCRSRREPRQRCGAGPVRPPRRTPSHRRAGALRARPPPDRGRSGRCC